MMYSMGSSRVSSTWSDPRLIASSIDMHVTVFPASVDPAMMTSPWRISESQVRARWCSPRPANSGMVAPTMQTVSLNDDLSQVPDSFEVVLVADTPTCMLSP